MISIIVFFFFNLELVVSGNFVLKRVGNLKSQPAFAGTGSLFSGLDSTLYSKCDQASDLWQQLELASELESDLRETVDWWKNWLVELMLEKLNWFHFTSLITLVLLI